MSRFYFLALALAASAAFAAPSGCDASKAKINLQSPAIIPEPTSSPLFVTVGLGVQNYTCTDAGNYTYVSLKIINSRSDFSSYPRSGGALAQILDISCAYGQDEFDHIPDDLYNVWERVFPDVFTTAHVMEALSWVDNSVILGKHFFTADLKPEWDFQRSGRGYVLGKKTDEAPAPTGKQDIAWLRLEAAEGDLSRLVYRTDTRGGQPPAQVRVQVNVEGQQVADRDCSVNRVLKTYP